MRKTQTKGHTLGVQQKVESLLSSGEDCGSFQTQSPSKHISAVPASPTAWKKRSSRSSTGNEKLENGKPVWRMSQNNTNALYGSPSKTDPGSCIRDRHVWSEDEYNSEVLERSIMSEASDKFATAPDAVMRPMTELKHVMPPRDSNGSPTSGAGHLDVTAETLADRKPARDQDSLDMMRVTSSATSTPSVGSLGLPENSAAAANVCPMSPQISTEGHYRFFASDTQFKDGSQHTTSIALSKQTGSSAAGDNPFSVGDDPRTLAEYLVAERVSFQDIEKEYKPHMRLLSILYGHVPSYLRYLAICEHSLKVFQLIPPNLLSVSKLLGGMGAPKNLISLAMISSSRAAGCKHSQAYSSVFAQRRGCSDSISCGGFDTDGELAVKTLAAALAMVPHAYKPSLGGDVQKHVPKPYDMEKIVMACGMMGFINKFADGIGAELTQSCVDDAGKVLDDTVWDAGQHAWASATGQLLPNEDAPEPPVDGMTQLVGVTRCCPQINLKQKALLKSISKDSAEARSFIAGLGFDEPLLEELASKNMRHTLAGVLYYTLNPDATHIGVFTKALAGIVFTKRLGSKVYNSKCHILAMHYCVDKQMIASAEAFDPVTSKAVVHDPSSKMDYKQIAALSLAYALGPSPAQVTVQVIERCKILKPEEIVEIVTFVSVLQMLHRMTVWRTGK